MKEPFTLFRQKKLEENAGNGTQIWYVRYINPQTGERMTAKSLEKLNQLLYGTKAKPIKTKAQAYKVAQAVLDNGLLESLSTGDILFSEYALKVWDFEKSELRHKSRQVPEN